MPRVPVLNNRSVGERGIPNVQFNERSVDTRPVSQANQAVSQAAVGVGSVLAEVENHANQSRVADAKRKFLEFETDLKYNKDTGFLHSKKQNALDGYGKTTETWKKKLAEIEGTLSNDAQKKAFREFGSNRSLQTDRQFQNHMVVQTRALDKDNMEALVRTNSNAIKEGFADAEEVNTRIEDTVDEIKAFSKRNGESAESSKLMVQEFKSSARLAVAGEFLESGEATLAQEYVRAHRKDFTPDALDRIEGAVKKARITEVAQENVNKIFAKGLSLSDGLDAARAIKDKDVSRETAQLYKQRIAERKQFERLEAEDNFRGLFNDLREVKDWNKLSKNKFLNQPPKNQKQLIAYSEKLLNGVGVKTNPRTYQNLHIMATTPETRDAFLQTDLVADYLTDLSESDLKKFINLQSKLRKGETDAVADVDGIISKNTILTQRLRQFDSEILNNKNKKQLERLGNLQLQVDREVANLKQEKISQGKKPKITNDEYRVVIDKLLTPVTVQNEFDGVFAPVQRFFDSTDDVPFFEVDGRRIKEVRYDDLGQQEIDRLANILESQGFESPSREQILMLKKDELKGVKSLGVFGGR